MAVRPWIRLDHGLLDDARFEEMDAPQVEAWLKSYLVLARLGDTVKDLAELSRLLGKQGVQYPAVRVGELDQMGWFVQSTRRPGTTMRGFERYQPIYRGPSDLPEAKALRNAERPTTRAGRRGETEER
jgi:hypothetical protein